jgi:hypothetical protein
VATVGARLSGPAVILAGDGDPRHCVQSKDRRFAHAVVQPRMIEFLLHNEAPAIDIENGRLCLSDGSSTWKPEVWRCSSSR